MIICYTLEQTDSHTPSLHPNGTKESVSWNGLLIAQRKRNIPKKSHVRETKQMDQHLSSVSCTSRYQSSAPVRLPHPAGCGCVSVANADLVVGHQSPSLPARPSWRHEKLHLLGATHTQHKIYIYTYLLLMYVPNVALYTRHLYSTLYRCISIN